MDSAGFDRLTRSFSHALSRRRLAPALGLVATGALHFAEAKNKKKKRKKGKKKQVGCVHVGGKCRGKDANCCSGICQGKKPKKGQKDKSRCVARNVLDCPAGVEACEGTWVECGTNGRCVQTTGQAGFCAVGFVYCRPCTKDVECEPEFGPGAACVVCDACAVVPGQNETACMAAAV